MTKKINFLLTMPFPNELVDRIRTAFPNIQVTQRPAKTPQDIPNSVWENTEILYTNHVIPTEVRAPNLRWIQFHWAGVESLLDSSILQSGKVVATSLSGAHTPQMGEYILMMLLALGHKLPKLVANQNDHNWPEDRWEQFLPFELRGSTVGIVGYGSIGRETARLLHAFDVTVLATKRNLMQPEDDGYTPSGMGDPKNEYVRRLYPSQTLKEMLKVCDFVVVAVPLTPENKALIGPEEFEAMKTGAFLVDVSRGGIVDQEALAEAILSKKIAGAALDVFPEEPLPKESPLWDFPNCFITPHISGVTPHYDGRAVELFITNLERYLKGQKLYNQVDIERGY